MSSAQGQIQFLAACPPPLEAGTYDIEVRQSLPALNEDVANNYQMQVTGPRFTLDPNNFNAFYPPPNHRGQFAGKLPQVTLNRRTLPWERTLDGSESADQSPLPWMAVLLLDESETVIPKVTSGTVADLLPPGEQGRLPAKILGPQITAASLEIGESLETPCQTIDLDSQLFQDIAPAKSDLPYLAHVRKLTSSSSSDVAGSPDDPSVAVVLGNRFPNPQNKNFAFLVSLEGFQDYLPDIGKIPSKYLKVRLVCLANWSFTCSTENQSFQGLMAGLDIWRMGSQPVGRLNLVPQDSGEISSPSPATVARQALLEGFNLLAHTTRQGEETASWYRSPLVPLALRATAPATYPCADAALRYDPEYGLINVSYAVAWQLGRLLALRDRSFANAVFAWRRGHYLRFGRQLTRRALAEKLRPLLPTSGLDSRASVKQAIFDILRRRTHLGSRDRTGKGPAR